VNFYFHHTGNINLWLQKYLFYENICFNSIEIFMRYRIDIAEHRFFYLKVLGVSPKSQYSNGETIWQAQCKCGNVINVPGSHLRSHLRKSCGCMWKPNDQDLIRKLKTRLETNCYWDGQCQCWKGPANREGYGITNLTDKTKILVHKLSWLIHIGKIPEGMKVQQSCGNNKCFRMDHLVLCRAIHKEC